MTWVAAIKSNLLRSSSGRKRARSTARFELSEHVELRRRRESQHLLELGHDVDLMTALENVYALLPKNDEIATLILAFLAKH